MGILAIVLALLALMFFWLQPVNIILGAAGALTGLIGIGLDYPAGGRPLRQAAAGVLLSLAALAMSVSLPLILRHDPSMPDNRKPDRSVPAVTLN
jgi:hypothetical protein